MLPQKYDFYLADNDAGRRIHYKLRYQVYCLREKFEDPSSHPSFLEQDQYDDISAHFIVRSRATGEWLGAMRLIIAPVQKLPVSRISSMDLKNFPGIPGKGVAEASRLCTLIPTSPRSNSAPDTKKARNRHAGPHHLISHALQTSWITVGLISAVRQYSLAHEILYCFFLISDPLARMLRRLGMEIDPVGSPCFHRGWRRPYMHNFKTGYQTMRARSPELYKVFCRRTAYARYSEVDGVPEVLPLAACGGDQQSVDLGSGLREPSRTSSDQRDREHHERSPRGPTALRF